MQTENGTSKPEDSPEQEAGEGCSGATCSGDAPDFITELRELLNRRSMENGSDTPDFILAQYLTDCLRAWNKATNRREDWYGRTPQEVSSTNVKTVATCATGDTNEAKDA